MRLLFIPVSAGRGTGEYARALAIAKEAARRSRSADIHFILSHQAPYAASVPFPATLLPSSPTFHVREVRRVIADLRPDIVIFDNAGRTAQLRAARAAGAAVVFVSSRERQRRRAFRLRWMRLLDEHWIAMPASVAGSLTLVERLKLRLTKRPTVRFLDTLLPAAPADTAAGLLERYGLHAGAYVLVVPGGGAGHRRMPRAPEIIIDAAERVASAGHAVLLVGVESRSVPSTPPLAMDELLVLVRAAQLVIVNGADTLLQVLACQKPCVAVPMAPDQVRRLDRLRRAGLPVGVELDAPQIAARALGLLADERARAHLVTRAAAIGISDGMGTAQDALAALLQERSRQ